MKNIFYIFCSLILVSCRSTQPGSGINSTEKNEVASQPTWQGSMKGLHQLLNTIEPLVFDSRQFVLPKNQSVLKFTIHGLVQESQNVSHSPTLISRDPTVRYVAAQFAEDLKMTEEAFLNGKTDFARYRLLKVTGYCVECHARTQHGPEFKFTRTESFMNKMTATNQVEYLIATRQFDRAYESAITTLKTYRRGSPLSWDVENVAHLGMQIAVQFRNSFEKAEKIVSTIEQNPDTPFYLKQDLSSWKSSLSFWKNDLQEIRDLDGIRNLIKNRKSEIDDMRVISNLLQMLAQFPKGDELGESLYLIGKGYENINEIAPLLLHENYYESCIRQVPHTKWSKKCFTSLQESIEFGYSGSGGMRVPMGVQVHLDNLKKEAE